MDLTLSTDQRALQTGCGTCWPTYGARALREAAAGAAPGGKAWRRIAELGILG